MFGFLKRLLDKITRTGDISAEIPQDPYPSPSEQLESWKSDVWTALDGVLVMSARDRYVCEACRKLDGTYYRFKLALEAQPLPHEDCTNSECRCTYLPIVDEEESLHV